MSGPGYNDEYCKRILPRSPVDIGLNTLLLAAVVASYVPQLRRLYKSSAVIGMSPAHISLQTLACGLLFTLELYLCSDILSCVKRGRIQGWTAFSALINLLQVFANWILSEVFLFMVVYRSWSSDSSNGPWMRFLEIIMQHQGVIGTWLAVHALFIVPAVVVVACAVWGLTDSVIFFTIVYVSFCLFLLPVLIPVFSIGGIPAQIYKLLKLGHTGTWSLSTLAAQVVVFLLLGVSQAVSVHSAGRAWWDLITLCPLISLAILALAQTVVLTVCVHLKRRARNGLPTDWEQPGERTALLGHEEM